MTDPGGKLPDRRCLRRCYCEIEDAMLLALARRRYQEGVPTLRLVREAGSPLEKEAAACVALLEHPEQVLQRLDASPDEAEHVRRCMERARATLAAQGIRLP